MGYGASNTGGASHAQSSELRQLFNTCGGNEVELKIYSRYLSPELAKQVLLVPNLEKIRLQSNSTGFFTASATQLELLNPKKPIYQFQVQRVCQVITVGTDATLKIARFGAHANNMRQPVGQANGRMAVSTVISITLNSSGGLAKINHTFFDAAVAIENIISFDVLTDAKL